MKILRLITIKKKNRLTALIYRHTHMSLCVYIYRSETLTDSPDLEVRTSPSFSSSFSFALSAFFPALHPPSLPAVSLALSLPPPSSSSSPLRRGGASVADLAWQCRGHMCLQGKTVDTKTDGRFGRARQCLCFGSSSIPFFSRRHVGKEWARLSTSHRFLPNHKWCRTS